MAEAMLHPLQTGTAGQDRTLPQLPTQLQERRAPRCHECNTSQGNSNARTNQNELQVSESAMQTPCPICSAAMQPRMGRNGTFMGCTEYPDCNGTLNVDDNGDIVAQPELRHNPRTASREAQPVKYDGSGWDAPTAAPKPQLPDRFRKAVEQVEKNLVQHAAACQNSEASTTQFLVMPMVAGLGWNEYDPDQLQKEYKPAGRRRFGQNIAVDIALFQSGQAAVFIEVKRLDRTYDESFKEQLERYAQYGTDGTIAILTNGATWIVHNVTDRKLGAGNQARGEERCSHGTTIRDSGKGEIRQQRDHNQVPRSNSTALRVGTYRKAIPGADPISPPVRPVPWTPAPRPEGRYP